MRDMINIPGEIESVTSNKSNQSNLFIKIKG